MEWKGERVRDSERWIGERERETVKVSKSVEQIGKNG